jgi:hypothetical protein
VLIRSYVQADLDQLIELTIETFRPFFEESFRPLAGETMRREGAKMVEIGTGGDPFHATARSLYESLGCTKLPVAVYFREL